MKRWIHLEASSNSVSPEDVAKVIKEKDFYKRSPVIYINGELVRPEEGYRVIAEANPSFEELDKIGSGKLVTVGDTLIHVRHTYHPENIVYSSTKANTKLTGKVNAAVNPWRTKYEVHWISPDGKDCLLGGSKTFEGAQDIAKDQAYEIFDSPFESNERKFHFLDSIYIVDMENGDEDSMSYETEEYIDNLMSELDSRI